MPGPRPEEAPPEDASSNAPCAHEDPPHTLKPAYRLTWARLLARVFRVDPAVCPACGGTMKVIAALTDPPSIRAYLDGVGLTPQPPPVAPARPQPQTQFEYA